MATCPICLDRMDTYPPLHTLSLPCHHTFHWECIQSYILATGETSTCPSCRGPLDIRTICHDDAYQEHDLFHGDVEHPLDHPLDHQEEEEEGAEDVENATRDTWNDSEDATGRVCLPISPEHRILQQKPDAPCYTLTTYTPNPPPIRSTPPTSPHGTPTHSAIYYTPETICTDHILLQRPPERSSPSGVSIETLYRNGEMSYDDAVLHLMLQDRRFMAHTFAVQHRAWELEQRRTTSCCCRCFTNVLLHSCECLAMGMLLGLTYGLVYAIGHVGHLRNE